MSSIPTAEEVLNNWQSNFKTSKPIIYDSLIEVMKEFAKLHVQKTKETLYTEEQVREAMIFAICKLNEMGERAEEFIQSLKQPKK